MVAPKESILAYTAAWSEVDEEKRLELLAKSWTEDGVYSDPGGEAAGREALNRHIGGFLAKYAGHRFVLTSGVDEHHGHVRFTWAFLTPDGRRLIEGIDFGAVDAQGRLNCVTGFFGQPRPVAPSWPRELVLKK